MSLWLDGNAAAGTLQEAFGTDMTTALRECGSCGERSAVGAHRLYSGAGLVLRCPACGDLAILLVALPDRHVVHVAGSWTFELPAAG